MTINCYSINSINIDIYIYSFFLSQSEKLFRKCKQFHLLFSFWKRYNLPFCIIKMHPFLGLRISHNGRGYILFRKTTAVSLKTLLLLNYLWILCIESLYVIRMRFHWSLVFGIVRFVSQSISNILQLSKLHFNNNMKISYQSLKFPPKIQKYSNYKL